MVPTVVSYATCSNPLRDQHLTHTSWFLTDKRGNNNARAVKGYERTIEALATEKRKTATMTEREQLEDIRRKIGSVLFAPFRLLIVLPAIWMGIRNVIVLRQESKTDERLRATLDMKADFLEGYQWYIYNHYRRKGL